MESMGQLLKTTRERKRLSLSYVAAQTHIKMQFLEMMERDDLSRMPAPMYAKGFIRLYANYLGLDPAPMVQEYMDVQAGRRRPNSCSRRVTSCSRTSRKRWIASDVNRERRPLMVSAPSSLS